MNSQQCNLLVIDNFYKNPMDVREFALQQDFKVSGNYPGTRTQSFATEQLKNLIQRYIEPFSGKITEFPMQPESYNGSFQFTTSRARSWVHTDSFNNWGGVLYLSPDAPVTAGTAFYKLKNGCMYDSSSQKVYADTYSQDLTKWELIDNVGNIFNRLILFNSKRYHMSMDYFGTDKNDSRLFQVFFFSTEK